MKKAKKPIALLLVLVLVLAVFAGCASSNSGDTDSSSNGNTQNSDASSGDSGDTNYLDNDPIRFATMPDSLGIVTYYAVQNGLFEEAGVNVELSMFSGGAAINEAVGAGELDGASTGTAGVYALSNNLFVLVGESVEMHTEGLIVRADSSIAQVKGEVDGAPNVYGSAETVKGAEFLCQLGQTQQLYAAKYAELFGLTENDITYVNMEPGPGYQAFITDSGDVCSTKNPYFYTMATDTENYVVAASPSDLGLEVRCFYMFTPEFLETRRDEAVIMLKVLYETAEILNSDHDLYREAIIQFYTENGKEFEEGALDFEIENNIIITEEYMTADGYQLGAPLASIADFYVATGLMDESVEANVWGNYDTSLIKDAIGLDVEAYTR